MSNAYDVTRHPQWRSNPNFGVGRGNQAPQKFREQFDEETLQYLDEKIINHLGDSIKLESIILEQYNNQFNDFSFFTAPAYKAFEGYLFQIARDLKLPSAGNPDFAGTYFDEEKIDKAIDNLIDELEKKAESATKLNNAQTQHIKDMVSEMKRFLVHYRHTPAHFHGDSITTLQRAKQNVMSMYRIINETTKTLLSSGMIKIDDRNFIH